jgi:hypothetical protein
MSVGDRGRRVPTLTEVVDLEPTSEVATRAHLAGATSSPSTSEVKSAPPGGGRDALQTSAATVPPSAADALVQRVLLDVQRQTDQLLEFRLREAMAPHLAQAAEALVRDLRAELSTTLRDVVARAVAQELARYRQR